MVYRNPSAVLQPAPDPGTRRLNNDQLHAKVACTSEEVWAAWQLVYGSYRRKKLINPNRYEIHCTPQSIQQRSAVMIATRDGDLTSTMSMYEDDQLGLPLDAVYYEELDALRQDGRRLYEVGMLADRCDKPSYRPTELFDIMRFAFHYGVWTDSTDMMVGVHPHHVAFYRRMLGFEVAGSERTYGLVRDNPVVLLKLDLPAAKAMDRPPRGLRYFLENPVHAWEFDMRFQFRADAIHGSMRECLDSFVEPKVLLEAA